MREHRPHHVAPGHEDGLVRGEGAVVQAEDHVCVQALAEAELGQSALEVL